MTRALLPLLAIALAGAAPAAAVTTPTIEIITSGQSIPLTPYTSGGWYTFEKPYYVARGTADPGATVTVTVTDALNSPAVTATATADNVGDWLASPNVTNLGLHGTTSSALTFTAIAKNGAQESAPATTTATKIAATPHDFTAPLLIVLKTFSGNWCREYSCDTTTWKTLADNGVVLTGRGSPCQPSAGALDPVWRQFTVDSRNCGADKFLQGTAEDYTDSSHGFASEIADVKVTVVRKRDGALIKEYHPLSRRGTFASWAVVLKNVDYEVNEEYEWKVRASDAWGHSSEESDSFKVTP